MTLPTLSPEQREANRGKALESRKARAAALDEVRKGKVSLAEVLDSPESTLRRAYVRQVLGALPRVGRATVAKAMEEVDIDHNRRIQGLGHLQREALLARFGG